MFWAVLSAIGACADAAYYIVNKRFLRSLEPDLLAAAGFLVGGVCLLAIALARGIPATGPDFLLAVGVDCILNIIGTTLAFRALRSTDLSLAVPMLAFTPLFLIGTAAVILHEIPSAIGVLGIIVIAAGSYVLNAAQGHTGLMDPFRAMVRDPGVFSMLVVAFLYAVVINFDKMVVTNSDTVFGSGIVFSLLGAAFLGIFLLKQFIGRFRGRIASEAAADPATPRATGTWRDLAAAALIVGIFLTIETVAINQAYLQQIVPYVSAIKRTSILITVVYGTLVFREKELLRRISGAGLMVLGVILILLFP
jgi:drug/metabolite transporter (DMT)-like permease